MSKETQYIIKTFESTLSGQPWFGRGVYEMLGEIDESIVKMKPNNNSHSLLELLWHMNTWAEFTLATLEGRNVNDLQAIEKNDWRDIDPVAHSWRSGVAELRSIHSKIISLLSKKEDDSFLSDMVPTRQYNFRFMLNGLIQHNIYHLGQVAYVKKMLMA
jgi:uncharacterized damage-inducible protein DinB